MSILQSSSGIVDVQQQKLNCALPSFVSLSSGFFRFQSLHGMSGSDQLIHSTELAVDLFNRSSNLEIRRR